MTPSTAGVLLVNVGTPEAPRTREVRAYLAEFLSDPHVIDLPAPLRFLLLRLVILPFRSPRSAEAYARIWTEAGSPLLVHGRALCAAVDRALGERPVVLGMGSGRPSIREGLEDLRQRGCERVVLFPLYPQFATSTTTATRARVASELKKLRWSPEVVDVPPFFDDEQFLEAFAARGRPILARGEPDVVLFSFHGLPERHIRALDSSGQHCLVRADCCATRVVPNCYRAQCFATAHGLAERLGLAADDWQVAFQSRLGRSAWIAPSTDAVLDRMADGGARRVVVFCPSFVADCLETLEEVGMGYRERFLARGGEELELVPSLNSEPGWVDAVATYVRRALGDEQ